jgi:hypothetical protein
MAKENSEGASPKKMSKWEAERRKRKAKHVVPILIVLLGVSMVAAAVVLLPAGPGPAATGCEGLPLKTSHFHVQLTITKQGVNVPVPDEVGIAPQYSNDRSLERCATGHGGSVSPTHTHTGEPGVIHVESVVERDYTLGDFFRVWGQPLGPSQTWDMTAGAGHELHLFVNGVESQEWGSLILRNQQSIEIHYT